MMAALDDCTSASTLPSGAGVSSSTASAVESPNPSSSFFFSVFGTKEGF